MSSTTRRGYPVANICASGKADFPPVDGVITSPPYVGLIDYHEQHAYAYHLLGLRDLRDCEIGAASNGASERAKQQYMVDIATVFRRIAQIMPSGAPMVVVANDKHNLYGRIAEMVGVQVEAVLYRHVNRRTGRRCSEFYEFRLARAEPTTLFLCALSPTCGFSDTMARSCSLKSNRPYRTKGSVWRLPRGC